MKLKQSLHLVLVALFIWTFQSVTIHSHQHLIEEETECHLCHASEQLDLHHNESTPIVVNEHIAVEVTETEEKVTVRSKFTNSDIPQIKRIDITGKRYYLVASDSVGYFSTAPPTTV